MQLELELLEKKLSHECRGVPFTQAASTLRILEGLGSSEHSRRFHAGYLELPLFRPFRRKGRRR
jgi:hypothetical protein